MRSRNWSLLLGFPMAFGWGTIAIPPTQASELSPQNNRLAASETLAQPVTDDTFTDFQTLNSTSNSMEQVTSVSQLTDVKPTDWAFQALKSLVERYGCIVWYPDKTYRGNRALTRWEFAAGLNACLDKIQELIAAATADFVKKEDLETVKRLPIRMPAMVWM